MVENRLRLQVSKNKRYLEREDGTPFFWLGDTAWQLFHKLNREEASHYLSCRAEQGFNVVQAVALGDLVGTSTGNAYGRVPLLRDAEGRMDPASPDLSGPYSYWEHVDFVLETAAEKGIYVALLPTWGDKFNKQFGKGPEIFTAENAYAYGRWLGMRYREHPQIIWVLGGDRALQKRSHFEIVNAMAEGLREGDGGKHLMTFHPKGSASSSGQVHEEDWLDFNMIQSGHGGGEQTNYRRVQADYGLSPVKPVLDAEPCYEDFPRGFNPHNGYFDEDDVRQAAYYAVFSGAFGHTYGHQSVWAMCDGLYDSVEQSEPGAFFIMSWQDALLRPGASQMRHLKALMESFGIAEAEPDQTLIAHPFAGANYMPGIRGAGRAMIYCPNGLYVDVSLNRIGSETVRAAWFNPRNGQSTQASEPAEFPGSGIRRFFAPSSGRGNDWVLVLNKASSKG
ncbi:glycoside hydrolase family 140 protein [Cohnella sp.]|uniref:glycoside hydrolase family 140 protein n=1 Tax=Cohnella sp. TaxID=1883426 RepID=UPI00356668C7